jgi:hypothetical protein
MKLHEVEGRTVLTWQTYYDFKGKFGWDDANFIVHPEHFFVSLRPIFLTP